MAEGRKAMKIAIVRDSPGFVRLYCPYRRDFVEALKDNIEPRYREPVYEERNGKQRFSHWRIADFCVGDIVKLLEDFFAGQEIESDLVEDEGSVFDELFAMVPDDKVDKAYRLLSQLFHPDLGGDDQQFRKLSEAYGRRKGE